MTLAELTRAAESYSRTKKNEAKEKAIYDYILADLIGRSVARLHSNDASMPTISECYPSLFQKEEDLEKRQALQDELSALRLKQFADSFNKRFKHK